MPCFRLLGWHVFLLHHMCAQSKCFLHVACSVEHICLGADVVEVVDELGFWDAWHDRRTVFEFAVVSKHAMHDEVYLTLK